MDLLMFIFPKPTLTAQEPLRSILKVPTGPRPPVDIPSPTINEVLKKQANARTLSGCLFLGDFVDDGNGDINRRSRSH
jgi:hypothetical protein